MSKIDTGPAVGELDDAFEIVRATIGKTTYVLHELDITEYQKQLDKAKTEEDRIDNLLLLRLLVREATRTMPREQAVGLTALECWNLANQPPVSFLAALPTKVARKINDLVNEMHYGDVETDEERTERERLEALSSEKKPGEGDAPGPRPI